MAGTSAGSAARPQLRRAQDDTIHFRLQKPLRGESKPRSYKTPPPTAPAEKAGQPRGLHQSKAGIRIRVLVQPIGSVRGRRVERTRGRDPVDPRRAPPWTDQWARRARLKTRAGGGAGLRVRAAARTGPAGALRGSDRGDDG